MSETNTLQAFMADFTAERIDTGEATIFVRHGGSGPPLLLLHGVPETHVMWHALAPRLAQDFTVVAADLRGYGASSMPPSRADHAPYAKRAMARDMAAVMKHLGFDTFAVAGHDRGGRVAYRLALDSPEQVTKLAVLDVIPTADTLDTTDATLARLYWVWFFLAQDADLPERMVGADPKTFLDHMLASWASKPDAFSPEVRAAYLRNFTDPVRLHAICEEYRAALSLDRDHDAADRGTRRIQCPMLALWSADGPLEQLYDVLAVWRTWADDVQGWALPCGHFLPEEAPNETFTALHDFFRT